METGDGTGNTTAPPDDPAILRAIDDADAPDLEGLSCRWEPLAASRGQMIALMVQPIGSGSEAEVFRQILARLSQILEGSIAGFAPASDQTLRFRWPPRGLALEARATAGRGSFLRNYAWALVTALFLRLTVFGLRNLFLGIPSYLQSYKMPITG